MAAPKEADHLDLVGGEGANVRVRLTAGVGPVGIPDLPGEGGRSGADEKRILLSTDGKPSAGKGPDRQGT